MRFRDYRPADFESIWQIDQGCFPPGIAYSRAEVRAFVSRKTAEAIVAESNGRIVAFVLGWRRAHTEGHVITLDVTAPARRQGFGRRLMAELERRFCAAGVEEMQLETAVTNATAIRLYEGLGYRKVAPLRNYYGPGLHAWRMQKALRDSAPGAAPRAAQRCIRRGAGRGLTAGRVARSRTRRPHEPRDRGGGGPTGRRGRRSARSNRG